VRAKGILFYAIPPQFVANTPCAGGVISAKFVPLAEIPTFFIGHRQTLNFQPLTFMAQKITPFLWFNDNAEEAVNLYTSLFEDSEILSTARYPEGSPGPAGSVMTIQFRLFGQEYIALNGGPHFKFTEAISFVINCKDQEEVDKYWNKLVADGGQESMCGWLKDKFGLSWQVVPTILGELMADKDKKKAQHVMHAMLKMKKINVEELKRAYGQK
jgi:predicted 3-demethylubiquinone-9 3-methyltransferase (glyoxalase superfamily)